MANPGIQVPYNFELKALEKLLSTVQRPGDYFVAGSLEAPMPRMEVEGVGLLSFPVPEIQAGQLIQNALRAPYGRGEETVLDESVRKVWQVPADRVKMGGKSWDGTFGQILATVANGLGCPAAAVQAELYKLLLYDEGGFFKAHRDTEKSDGMFGTLIVVLPSEHQGGELVIRHAGREVTVDLSSSEVSELRFAAFYADCEHEVLPVTRGHRVCLVYNLVQRGTDRPGEQLAAPLYDAEAEAAARGLREAFAPVGSPAKLAWLLEHQYSPDGLSFEALKGADAARASVLRRAAERAGCVMHLAIVHIEETGPAEPQYDQYSHRRSRWRGYEEPAREQEGVSSDRYEVVEVSDASRFVDEWRDLDDGPVDFGRLPLEEGEVLPAGALDGEKPDEQRLTEATGNEGATFERSYHRAALVIWPRDRFADVLLQAGVGAALPLLVERIASRRGAPEDPTDPTSAIAIARRIVEAWEGAPGYPTHRSLGKVPDRGEMVRLLGRLGDSSLLEQLIAGVVTRQFDGTEAAALADGAGILGPQKSGKLFTALARENAKVFHAGCVTLLHGMVRNLRPGLDSEWKTPLSRIAAAIIVELPKIEMRGDPYAGSEWWRTQKARPMDAAEVVELLESLRALDSVELHTAAVAVIRAAPAVFDPVTVVVPALQQLPAALGTELTSDPVRWPLWLHAAEFLLARSERPPELPVDWRQEVSVPCKCEDCRELQAFVRDPVAKVHRFRVRQDRRQHLHGQIEHHGLDLTHVTERQGSPQTLVCTKTRRSYQRQCAQHTADRAAMGALLGLLGTVPGDGEISRVANRLYAATALKPRPDLAAPCPP